MTANLEPDNDSSPTQADLVARLNLMETMIAEGRRKTMRCGWIFVLWGLVDLTAMAWQYLLPNSNFAGPWAWPICLVAGTALTLLGVAIQKRSQGYSNCTVGSRVMAVWGMMGIALALYVASAMMRHLTWQFSYAAAILMMIGLAHAISAVILRWRVQAVVAAIWWAGGIATIFAWSWRDVRVIWLIEMCLGMIAFGLYVMWLEYGSAGSPRVPDHG